MICSGKCIGSYLSDIAGAFDRVFRPYIMNKLRALGLSYTYLDFLASWLDKRFGQVVVEGEKSKRVVLENQIFQGTVLGPSLWNIFFADVIRAATTCNHDGKAFADDFNCFRAFDRHQQSAVIYHELEKCKANVHEWGTQHRVTFEASKEAFVILHPRRDEGEVSNYLAFLSTRH